MTTPEQSSASFRELLASHGLSGAHDTLLAHGIDSDLILDLTEADFAEIGLSIGDRKRVTRLQVALRDRGTRESSAPRTIPERRQMTVLFADMVGSTSLSQLLDPEDLRAVMRAFHRTVDEEVARYGGHVAQHLGDGAVVYFGWPEAHELDSERAVRAALSLIKRVSGLTTPARRPLQTRVGIATGMVVVGDLVENAESRERPVIGEAPNLAARLVGLAPPDGVVVSDASRRMVGDLFEFAELGLQQLKGFADPVRTWQVIGESSSANRFAALRGGELSPLVGRDRETAVLREAWRAAQAGRGTAVHLSGLAGLGKSRLVRWMRDLVAADGGAERILSCSPYHGGSAFYPFIRELEASADMRATDSDAVRWSKLEAIAAQDGFSTDAELAVIAKLLQITPPVSGTSSRLEPFQEKEIVLASLGERMISPPEARPLLVVIEDLHWMDPSSLELIERVITRLAERQVLLLFTYRPVFTPSFSTAGHVRIELAGLNAAHCREIVTALGRGGKLDDEMISQIVARTDGVPLFVEELTKTMIEAGREHAATEGGARRALRIPETLQDSLLSRLDRLGEVKYVAQVASCLGRDFHRSVVGQITGLNEAALDAALRRLVESNLVEEDAGALGTQFIFKHALVQEAAYESLLKATRVDMHSRIAATLEGDAADTAPQILAYHFGRAGMYAREIDFLLLAGQHALSTTAFREAIQHLSAGLDALGRLSAPDPGRELALQVHIAVPLTLTRGWAAEEVGATYRRAYELCQVLGESPSTFPTLVGVFTYYLVRGEFERAYELGIGNEAVARASGDVELIMEAAHDRGTSSLYMGRLDEALPYLREASALYRTEAHGHHAFLYSKLPGPTALVHEVMALAAKGQFAEGIAVIARARRLAEEGSHSFTRIWVMTAECILHHHRRDHEAMGRVAEEMLSESREYGFPNWLAQAMVWKGWVDASKGDLDGGIDSIRQGLAIWAMTGAELMKPMLTTLLVDVLVMRNELEEAEREYVNIAALIDRTGERWCEGEVHRVGATIARRLYGPVSAEAQARAERGLAAAAKAGASLYSLVLRTDLARSHHASGDTVRAREILSDHLQTFASTDAPVFAEPSRLFVEIGA